MLRLVTLAAAALALAGCSATSYYQTGVYRNNDTGRQVAAGYAGANDNFGPPSGDYCTTYQIGGGCQSDGVLWRNTLAGGGSGSQHRVQLGYDTNGVNRPFADDGTLVLTETIRVTGVQGGDWHGYLCPTFIYAGTGAKVEYCLELWRSDGSNYYGTGQAFTGDGGYEIWADVIKPGGPYVSPRSAQQTIHGAGVTGTFDVTITARQAAAALRSLVALNATDTNSIGADPSQLSLYQIQAGYEGGGGSMQGESAGLQAYKLS